MQNIPGAKLVFFFVLDPPKTSTFVKVELNYRKAQKQGKNQGVPGNWPKILPQNSKGPAKCVYCVMCMVPPCG
jgi:hypothetical protein